MDYTANNNIAVDLTEFTLQLGLGTTGVPNGDFMVRWGKNGVEQGHRIFTDAITGFSNFRLNLTGDMSSSLYEEDTFFIRVHVGSTDTRGSWTDFVTYADHLALWGEVSAHQVVPEPSSALLGLLSLGLLAGRRSRS